MFGRLFASRRPKTSAIPAVPDDHRVYAIGDIHGRADLLQQMHRQIGEDAAAAEAAQRTVIYLGDYVDRGMQSREVIDLLLDEPLVGFDSVHLMGNHEEFLLAFAHDLSSARSWLYNGGDTTLHSYGVVVPAVVRQDLDLAEARDAFFASLPARHLDFFRSLRLYHEIGDYFFVHAGVRPGVPLQGQSHDDMLWIRQEFLRSNADFGRIVVHGHSITREVDVQPNRIGIDTGAYNSGILSCLVLQGAARWLLQT